MLCFSIFPLDFFVLSSQCIFTFHPKTIYSVLPMATNSPPLICMDFCIACSLEVMLSSLVARILSGYLGQPLASLEPGVKGPEFPVQPQLPG